MLFLFSELCLFSVDGCSSVVGCSLFPRERAWHASAKLMFDHVRLGRYSPADCRGTTCIAWWLQYLLKRESSVQELWSMEIRDAIAKMDAINLFSSLSPSPGFPPPLDSSSHTSASSDTAMSKLNRSQEALQQNTVPEGNGALLQVKPKVAQRSAPPHAVQNEEVSTSPQPQRQWTSPPPTRVSVGARVL